ncbi:MAG: ammonium transporter, partial [Pseudomonadota bacterium]|nr:ammonium transporter [Pseudomonadota bacterium]
MIRAQPVGGVGGAVAGKMIGPRLGRYADNGEIQEIPGHSATLSCLGTLLLWFGWFGFNGSSTLGLS